MGAVSDLRLIEDLGRRVRLGWTGVPGATEYKVTVRNTQGESGGWGHGAIFLASPVALRAPWHPAPYRRHREDEARPRHADSAGAG